MIELGISQPAQTEARASQSESYSDLIVAGLLATAGGGADPISSASGAVTAAAGVWARCLAAADVDHPAVSRECLGAIGYDLATVGEHVSAVVVDAGGVRLVRASSWDVQGYADPASWRYRVNLSGPSFLTTMHLEPSAVLHIRYLPDSQRPWCGVAPWKRAPELAALAARIEGALKDEARQPVMSIVPMPQGMTPETKTAMRGDVSNRKHGVIFPDTTSSGHGAGRSSAPPSDWKPTRLKPDPSEAMVMLCKDIPAAVGACYGIPPVLMHGGGSETVTREAFRRMIVATIAPLAALASEALSVALSAPVALNLRALRAYDTQGNARAYGALIKSGMGHSEASELTGLDA